MTQTEFAEKYTQPQLKEIAAEIAKEVVIRSYQNGNSSDKRRRSTAEEQEILSKIVYAALIAYGYRSEENGGSIDAILDMAEFTCHQFLPDVNTYDSIYIPVRKTTETW